MGGGGKGRIAAAAGTGALIDTARGEGLRTSRARRVASRAFGVGLTRGLRNGSFLSRGLSDGAILCRGLSLDLYRGDGARSASETVRALGLTFAVEWPRSAGSWKVYA